MLKAPTGEHLEFSGNEENYPSNCRTNVLYRDFRSNFSPENHSQTTVSGPILEKTGRNFSSNSHYH